jgi:plasmid maintenance system killer protein
MRLTQLDAATQIEDLRQPPSNRLEASETAIAKDNGAFG